MMKPAPLVFVVLLLALVNDVAAFLAPPTPTTFTMRSTSAPLLLAAKKTKDEDLLINKKNKTVKDWLRLIVTGSPDGISNLGKPQIDWSTGKPTTVRKAFDWNISSQNNAAKKKDAKKK